MLFFSAKMTGKAYTMQELKAIVNYLIEHNAYKDVKGRKLWVDFANSKVTNRTWQSLKETFIKRILPDIHNPYYKLTVDQICSFRQGQDLTSSKKLEFEPTASTGNVKSIEEQPSTSKTGQNTETAGEKIHQSHTRSSTDTLILEPELPLDNGEINNELKETENKQGSDKRSIRDFITYSEPLTPMMQAIFHDFSSDEDNENMKLASAFAESNSPHNDVENNTKSKKDKERMNEVSDVKENELKNKTCKENKKETSPDILEILGNNIHSQNTKSNTQNSNSDSLLPNNQEDLSYQNNSEASTSKAPKTKPSRKRSNSISQVIKENDMNHKVEKQTSLVMNSKKLRKLSRNGQKRKASIPNKSQELNGSDIKVKESDKEDVLKVSTSEEAVLTNPCLQSVSLYAKQFSQSKISHNTTVNVTKSETNNITVESKISMINDNVLLLKSNSESDDSLSISSKPLGILAKSRRDKALANVVGFSIGGAKRTKEEVNNNRKKMNNQRYKQVEMTNSSEWTSDTETECDAPPSNFKRRNNKRYLKPQSSKISALEEEGGLFVVHNKKIFPVVASGKEGQHLYTYIPEDSEEEESYWKMKYIEERKKCFELERKLKEQPCTIKAIDDDDLKSIAEVNKEKALKFDEGASIKVAEETSCDKKEDGTVKIKFTKNNEEVQLEGRWQNLHPVLEQVVHMFHKESDLAAAAKKNEEEEETIVLSGKSTPDIVVTTVDEVTQAKVNQLEKQIFEEIEEREKEESDSNKEKVIDKNKEIISDSKKKKFSDNKKRALDHKKDKDFDNNKKKVSGSKKEKDSDNKKRVSDSKKEKDSDNNKEIIFDSKEEKVSDSTKERVADRQQEKLLDEENITKRTRSRQSSSMTLSKTSSDKSRKEIENSKEEKLSPTTTAKRSSSRLSGNSNESPTNIQKETEKKILSKKNLMKKKYVEPSSENFDVLYKFPSPPPEKKRKSKKSTSYSSKSNSSKESLPFYSMESSQGYQDSDVSPIKLRRKRKISLSLQSLRVRKRSSRCSLSLYNDSSSDSSNSCFRLSLRKSVDSASINTDVYKSDSYQLLIPQPKSFSRLERIDEITPQIDGTGHSNSPISPQCIVDSYPKAKDGQFGSNSNIGSEVGNSSNISLPLSPELSIVENISVSKNIIDKSVQHPTLNETESNNIHDSGINNNFSITNVDASMPLLAQKDVLRHNYRNSEVTMPSDVQSRDDMHCDITENHNDVPITNTVTESLLDKVRNVNIEEPTSISLDEKLQELLLESAKKAVIMLQNNDIQDKENRAIDTDTNDKTKKKSRARKRCSTPRKRKHIVKSKPPNVDAIIEERMEFCSYGNKRSCPPSINIIPADRITQHKHESTRTGRKQKDVIKVKITRPKKQTRSSSRTSVPMESVINDPESGIFLQGFDDSVSLIHNHSETCLHAHECADSSVEFIERSDKSIISINTSGDISQTQSNAESMVPDVCNNQDAEIAFKAQQSPITRVDSASEPYKTPPNQSLNSLLTEDLSDETPAETEKQIKRNWYLFSEEESNTNFDIGHFKSSFGANLNQIFPVTFAVPNLSTITELSQTPDSRKPTSETDSSSIKALNIQRNAD